MAIEEGQPLHYSADKQVWDRRNNRVELFGHATVNQPGETINADYIILQLDTRDLDAKGNCVYIASDAVIFSEEMHFNLETRTGTIIGGRVSNERFSLAGERINKLGEGRFQTHWGEYSTCRDCPQSWAFQAEDVDMQIDGYASMKNVTVKIKDSPGFWLPYLLVPMKTRRQTGLLFPRFSFSSIHGGVFVLPFFWAINRSADMTVGAGEYTARGRRLEWEGRYALSDRSGGQANFFYINDSTFGSKHNRWGLGVLQTQELPFSIEQKLKIAEVSDNRYPIFFETDIPRNNEKYLTSNFILSHGSSSLNAYIALTRTRNLLPLDADPGTRETRFDQDTVQTLPSAIVTTNDRFLFGSSLATGLTLGVSNFTRTGDSFDFDQNGNPIIRKATRFSFTPSVYTTLRPLDVISIVPSAQYRGFYYLFHNESGLNNLQRGYVLLQTDISTQIEKVYDTSDPDIPRMKHLIRPTMTYSYIPYFSDISHPFQSQIDRGIGHNFDSYDIVPLFTSPNTFKYYVPLGNSIAYGFTTQLIRRKGKVDAEYPVYQRTIEWSNWQSINFRKNPNGPYQPYSRFISNLIFQFDKFASNNIYYYYPYLSGFRHQFNTSITYTLEKSTHQRIMTFDRSISLGYNLMRLGCSPGQVNCDQSSILAGLNYSINDYVLPTALAAFDLGNHRFSSAAVGLLFQSPSQCWRFSIGSSYSFERHSVAWSFDLALNLTGSGYGGVSEIANSATTR